VPAWRTILLAGAVLVLAGCGNTRTGVPSATVPLAPGGFRTLILHDAGVRISAPRAWAVTGQRAPLLVTVASGTAVLAVWRYAREAPAPAGAAAVRRLRIRLVAAIRARDHSVRVLATSATTVAGAGAVQIDALERIAGRPRRVSSTHVYLPGEELVLDAYAPPARFAAVDRTVFEPVRRSLARIFRRAP
jgi:hypothetical protein